MRTRLRSTIKWTGTVLTLLLLVVWVGSAWWYCEMRGSDQSVSVMGGQLSLVNWNATPLWAAREGWIQTGRQVSRSDPDFRFFGKPFQWWFSRSQMTFLGTTYSIVSVPIWPFVLAIVVPTGMLFYRDLRRAPGLCTNCGYDLRGADHAVCPECGAALSTQATS